MVFSSERGIRGHLNYINDIANFALERNGIDKRYPTLVRLLNKLYIAFTSEGEYWERYFRSYQYGQTLLQMVFPRGDATLFPKIDRQIMWEFINHGVAEGLKVEGIIEGFREKGYELGLEDVRLFPALFEGEVPEKTNANSFS